ncbi:hypothetical protein TNCV_4216961 [Trichonephila clavipes]|nr:hypothetical protein TNCV_4216961 [Trichonephila clavipes]
MLVRLGQQRQISASEQKRSTKGQNRAIVRASITAPDSSISTIHRVAHTHAQPEPPQTAERVKFTLAPTVTSLASRTCTSSNSIAGLINVELR